jgi:hypothetical protein
MFIYSVLISSYYPAHEYILIILVLETDLLEGDYEFVCRRRIMARVSVSTVYFCVNIGPMFFGIFNFLIVKSKCLRLRFTSFKDIKFLLLLLSNFSILLTYYK